MTDSHPPMKRYGNIVIAMDEPGKKFSAFDISDTASKITIFTEADKTLLYWHTLGKRYEAETWENMVSQIQQFFTERNAKEAERERRSGHWESAFRLSVGEKFTFDSN